MASTMEVKDVQAKTPRAAAEPQVRRKKSSKKADIIFGAFLATFFGTMVASFREQIPVFSWEKMTLQEHVDAMHLMNNNTWIPMTFGALYILLTFSGQAVLANRKGWDQELRLPLAWWSFFLAAFSIWGAWRTVPAMVSILQTSGLRHLVCGDTRAEWLTDNPAGFWTWIFCLSKVPELIDTAFIVLRKKELITLHWYHHVSVMIFCWHAFGQMSLNGIIFAAMNLTIHSVMYTFYGLTALGMRPNSFAKLITIGQILQMVVGTAVTAYVTLDKVFWHPAPLTFDFEAPKWVEDPTPVPDSDICYMNFGTAFSGLVMYSSYLYFFVAFFYTAYMKPGGKAKEA